MKTSVVLSALLSFGILGLAAGFMAGKSTRDARATAGSVSASDLARVEERLTAIEGGLEALGSLRSDVDALKRHGAARQDPVEPVPLSGTPVEEAAAPSRGEGEVPASKLENWLERQGMRGEFEDLVSRVYAEARSARMAREKAEQEEMAREMKALSEGPYGKLNYRVNSLSKKLGLDARQEEYVYNLLLKYEERRKQELDRLAVMDGEDSTPDRMRERMDQTIRVHQELSQQFESDLLAGLNPKQQEAYQDLPEHERGSWAGDSVKMVTFEAATGVLGMKTGVRFALPGAAEKPVPLEGAPAPPPERK